MNESKEAAENTNAKGKPSGRFSDEERAAMRERAKELKASANRAEAEKAVLEKIAEMPESDRVMAERIHSVIAATAPELSPKLWYGQPAYAKDGNIICFFQSAEKFNTRYATLGFNDAASIDEGTMWPTAFGLTKLTDDDAAIIGALVKKAVG